MAQYESEFTKFMREMMDAHLEWLEDRVVRRSTPRLAELKALASIFKEATTL